MTTSRTSNLHDIPGVGPSISGALFDLGIRRVEDLRDADPERLYERLVDLRGAPVDRCVLYVFRCAAYYASNREHDPQLLKWWNWKNRTEQRSDIPVEPHGGARSDPAA